MIWTLKRGLLAGGGALALGSALVCSTLVVAQDAPESLLPPGFDDPKPTPSPTPAPAPSRPGGTSAQAPTSAPSSGSTAPRIIPAGPAGAVDAPVAALPDKLPTLAELDSMSNDQIDELLGLKPKFDIPASVRRSMERVGVIDGTEGGMPSQGLAGQPASLVRAALRGTKGPLVSRWGHILLRRTLASRLAAPADMNPAEFAALRANVLNKLGEPAVARSLVQDVDTANYDAALIGAAFDSYIATSDILGICPTTRLHGSLRTDPQWQLARSICDAYSGRGSSAKTDLRRARTKEIAPMIDVLLAQRFANAAADARGAVTIEWDKVSELNPWRFSLANALGVAIPDKLMRDASPYYWRSAAIAPMLPLATRAQAADIAAREGILSAQAMVDLYAQIYADDEVTGDAATRAVRLRDAYAGETYENRMAAMRDIWGAEGQPDYGRLVLTAFAAARIPANEELADDAASLVASMLAAGLDRNAMRWGSVVSDGSATWGLLAVAQPEREGQVSTSSVSSFIDDDTSAGQRKSRFLVAGLAGLGRLDKATAVNMAGDLGVSLDKPTRWTRMIDKAAEVNNPTLVALLAGLGMQGDDWDKMTARHLYHIVSALNRVGLSAEARMIAAEAVARG